MKKISFIVFNIILFLTVIDNTLSQIALKDTTISEQKNMYNEVKPDTDILNDDVKLLIVGALIGFAFSMLGDVFRNKIDKGHRKSQGKQLLNSILEEIELGLRRCDYLRTQLKNGEVSFSRIYIPLWENMQVDISHYIYEFLKDPEILKHIHSIYYTFDLINFNMEREEFGVGAAFARDHEKKLNKDFTELKSKLCKLSCK